MEYFICNSHNKDVCLKVLTAYNLLFIKVNSQASYSNRPLQRPDSYKIECILFSKTRPSVLVRSAQGSQRTLHSNAIAIRSERIISETSGS